VISGFTASPLTTVHVLLSLIGILSGLVVLSGMFSAKRLNGICREQSRQVTNIEVGTRRSDRHRCGEACSPQAQAIGR
jgi:hypothetical protein